MRVYVQFVHPDSKAESTVAVAVDDFGTISSLLHAWQEKTHMGRGSGSTAVGAVDPCEWNFAVVSASTGRELKLTTSLDCLLEVCV